jgi:peptidyl-prolyl cis-trans isomerase D
MFEFVRNHKKWMQILLALLIVPSFVAVGVSSYGSGGAGGGEIANVGGKKITQYEFDEAQRRYIDNARSQMGDRFNPKEYETPEVKQMILDKLIENAAIDAEIRASHMTVGDAALQKSIAEIQAFHKPDGSFDLDKYKALLGASNMTPRQFDAQTRSDMTKRQLGAAIPGSAFVPRSVANRLSDIASQEREVQEVLFKADDFAAKVNVTDDMIKAYYDKHAALFQASEQAKVEYVVLDSQVVEGTIAISDADAQKFYENEKNKKYATPETRAVSHILIAKKDGDKARAEAILAELRKAPATFADLAKSKSEDTASGEQGGALGVVTEGKPELASPEVETAAFKLKQGEFELVKSDFGYHIVTVTKIEPKAVKPFDAVKAEIVAELKKAQMSKKYSDLAEQFTNTVYEQSDSLKPVAEKLKLEIKTVDGLQRTAVAAKDAAPVYSPKFLRAIFTDDAIKNKRNTEAVQVAPAVLVAGRIVDYKPAAKRPLAEVTDAIRKIVSTEEAVKLAKQAGEAKIAAAKAGGEAEGFGPVKTISRAKQPEIEAGAMGDLLKADTAKLPAYVGVSLPGMGYGVYRINKVSQPADADPARRKMEREQFNGVAGQLESVAYIGALKTKAKTKVSDKALAAKPVATEAE